MKITAEYLEKLQRKREAESPASPTEIAEQVRRHLPKIAHLFEYVGEWVWFREYATSVTLTGRDRATLRDLGFKFNAARYSWQHNCGNPTGNKGGNPLRSYGVRGIDEDQPVGKRFALTALVLLALASPAQSADYGLSSAADAAGQIAAKVCGATWPEIGGYKQAQCFARAREAAEAVYKRFAGTCSTDAECASLDRMAARAARKAATGKP